MMSFRLMVLMDTKNINRDLSSYSSSTNVSKKSITFDQPNSNMAKLLLAKCFELAVVQKFVSNYVFLWKKNGSGSGYTPPSFMLTKDWKNRDGSFAYLKVCLIIDEQLAIQLH